MPLNANEVDMVMEAAPPILAEGEEVRAIWSARGTRLDALMLTNERFMGVDLLALSSASSNPFSLDRPRLGHRFAGNRLVAWQ